MIDMHVKGRLWVGVRQEVRWWPSVRRVWAVEEDPPHRLGIGLGVRIWTYRIMAGVASKAGKPFVYESDYGFTAEEIGAWDGTSAEEDAVNA